MAQSKHRYGPYVDATLVFLALLTGALAFPLAEAYDRHTGAALTVDAQEHDWGVVPPGHRLRQTFHLHNRGRERVVVNPKACCGQATREPLILAPGETRPVEVILNTTGRYGHMLERVEFTSSDPQQPRLELVVRAFVRA